MSKYPNDPQQTMWVVLAKNGNNFAFDKIIEKYQTPIYNFCYYMLKDIDEAEEAAQESFLRVYINLASYDEKRLFSTWLFSIASNYCLDQLRKRQVRFSGWDKLVSQYYLTGDGQQPEKRLLEAETMQEVHTLLKTVPPEYRTALILKYWHAMSYEEIAQVLNTTVSAIKSKLFRARKMMAETATQQPPPGVTPNYQSLALSY